MIKMLKMVSLSPLRRIPSRGIPSWAGGYGPIAIAGPLPVRLLDESFLCSDECVHWAHAVLILRAAFDARQRSDTVVDDDADLRIWESFTCKDWRRRAESNK